MKLQTGIYRHFQNGSLYFVEKLALYHSNGNLVVILHPLYNGSKLPLCRDLSDFDAHVPDDDNNPVKQFRLIYEISSKMMKNFIPGNKIKDWRTGKEYCISHWEEKDSVPRVILTTGQLKSSIALRDFVNNMLYDWHTEE
jgi:hypothetical protein